MKSVLRYYGGKAKLASWIIERENATIQPEDGIANLTDSIIAVAFIGCVGCDQLV